MNNSIQIERSGKQYSDQIRKLPQLLPITNEQFDYTRKIMSQNKALTYILIQDVWIQKFSPITVLDDFWNNQIQEIVPNFAQFKIIAEDQKQEFFETLISNQEIQFGGQTISFKKKNTFMAFLLNKTNNLKIQKPQEWYLINQTSKQIKTCGLMYIKKKIDLKFEDQNPIISENQYLGIIINYKGQTNEYLIIFEKKNQLYKT